MKCLALLIVLCGIIHLSEVNNTLIAIFHTFLHSIFNSQQGLTKAQVDEMTDKFLKDCAAKEGATADDIQYLKDRNFPNTAGQRCIVACVGENFALVKRLLKQTTSLK